MASFEYYKGHYPVNGETFSNLSLTNTVLLAGGMKLFLDFFPIVLFFAAYKLADIYVATLAAIVGSVLLVGFTWLTRRKVETMHLVSMVLIVVFGGLTWYLRDPTFIKWKPTVLNWLFGVMFLGSQFIGEKPVIQRMLSAQITLPAPVWLRLNLAWTAYFLVIGAVNLYVAYTYEEQVWVNFKLFGMLGLTFVFVLLQSFYLSRFLSDQEVGDEADVQVRTED